MLLNLPNTAGKSESWDLNPGVSGPKADASTAMLSIT